MTAAAYRAWLAAHDLNHESAGLIFAVSARTSRSWAEDYRAIPPIYVRLMGMIDSHRPLLPWLRNAAGCDAAQNPRA